MTEKPAVTKLTIVTDEVKVIGPRNSIKETMELLKLSRTAVWERMKDGRLPFVKDGTRVYVTGDALKRYLLGA